MESDRVDDPRSATRTSTSLFWLDTSRARLDFENLVRASELEPALLSPDVRRQLAVQGRRDADAYRYRVRIRIIERDPGPAKDLDNYAKPIIDAITQSGLMWRDDAQIDELVIKRRRSPAEGAGATVQVWIHRVVGQHGGVPTYFRAQCFEASQGGNHTYEHAGFCLACSLDAEVPFDVDDATWSQHLEGLRESIHAGTKRSVVTWFQQHLPRFISLVPSARRSQFVAGVRRAFDAGEI